MCPSHIQCTDSLTVQVRREGLSTMSCWKRPCLKGGHEANFAIVLRCSSPCTVPPQLWT